jgi:hypothetical protein
LVFRARQQKPPDQLASDRLVDRFRYFRRNQVAELARLAEMKRTNPKTPSAQTPPATQSQTSIMPDQTRDMLKRLAKSMRRAAGLESTPAATLPERGALPAGPADEKARSAVPGRI